jgi:hypothetical protein
MEQQITDIEQASRQTTQQIQQQLNDLPDGAMPVGARTAV